jgi:hypothetical protein
MDKLCTSAGRYADIRIMPTSRPKTLGAAVPEMTKSA